MMRLYVATAALLALALPAAAATKPVVYSDPIKLLTDFYSAYKAGGASGDFPDPDVQRSMQSKRLNDLYDKDAKDANGEVGRIDFDPFINGQDYQLSKLKFGAPYYAGGKATVHVTFNNFDEAQDEGIALVKEDGGWKIDDVWNGSKDYPYDLLDILQAPFP